MILAIVTLLDGECELLPHWIDHYTKLKCDKLLIVVNEALSEISTSLPNHAIVYRFSEPDIYHVDSVKHKHEYAALESLNWQDWILWTDLDEFQQYNKGGLLNVLARGYNAISGKLLDRIKEDRSFGKLLPAPSIFEQFPYAGWITQAYGGCINKVMATKGPLKLGDGRHFLHAKTTVDSGHTVFHFKYREAGIQRIRDRIGFFEQRNSNHWYKRGSQRLLSNDHIDEKIPLKYFGEFKYG